MSARSTSQNTTGSVHGSIKLAGEEAKDRMYEPKHKKKVVRVLTVIAYVFSVSLAAIMLSLYYIFIWQGTKPIPSHQTADLQCRPSDGKNLNHEKIINFLKIPISNNESQILDAPRALPSREEQSTVPLSPLVHEHHEIKKQEENYSSLSTHK